MLYRKLEKTGEELSILGYGCLRLPLKSRKIDVPRATRQIRYAIDKGVNYIDTAMPYHNGANELFLGQALSDGYRRKVNLCTKLTGQYIKTRQDMDKILDVQLHNLQTEQIDYYLLHGIDGKSWERLKGLGVLDFLDKVQADGRIRFAGFSFHGDKEVFKEIVDAYDWVLCQIQYNYLDEHNQAGTSGLKYAAQKGLGIIIMEPLRGGHLAGKIPPEVQAIWDEAEVKRSPAEWGLRWIWNRPEVTVVLSGMNQEDHIEENLRMADHAEPNSLTEKELQLVKRVAKKYKALTRVGCTGCRYCMPCPEGVDIPTCFELYNNRLMFDDKMNTKIFYITRLGDPFSIGKTAYASECKNCGQCEEACPQNLPIQAHLQDVSKEFEGRFIKIIGWVITKLLTLKRWMLLRKAKQVEKKKLQA